MTGPSNTGETGGTGTGDHGERRDRRTDLDAVERRRRRARVFGEVLPDRTSDERGDAWGEKESSSDEWLRSQVPPHHG